jgi:uncharacterized protein (TIGR03437 family)
MMRTILALCLLTVPAVESRAEIRLPASGVLAAPIDDAKSSMGDAISNYPFGSGVGTVNLHGWVAIDFSPPTGRTARFRMRWHTVGDVPLFSFASGHFLHVTGEQNLNSTLQLSQGDLNLDTGEVTNLEVHAIFQNVLIQKSSKYDRLPLVSDASSFTALFGDFPPLDFPFELPFKERPVTFQTVRFAVDASQQITGFEFHGVTFIPITVLPELGIMPPYAFGRKGVTIVPGMEGCLPGTTPPDQCLSEARLPDGIISPDNAYLSPNLHLVTSELREIAGPAAIPPALPGGPVMGAGAAAVGGQLYVTGGSDGDRPSSRVSVFDPARNQWTSLPDMPRTLWRHCTAGVGGNLYVVGGREESGTAPVNAVSAFDPATRTWSEASPLPVATADAACASLDSRIFLFGGTTAAAAASDAAWVFDEMSGQWSELSRMPAALAGSAVAVAGREIWIINGTTDGLTATDRVLVFSPDSGTWREGPATTRGVYGASAAWLEGRIYLAGGRTAPGGPLDVGSVLYHSQTMQVLAGGVWWAGLYPPLPAGGTAGAVVGDTWYLAGGDTSSDAPAPTGIVQSFEGARGWAASDSYPVFAGQTVRNAAGLGVGPVELAPGAVASILGMHLAQRRLAVPSVRSVGPYLTTDLPDELDGVRVTVDGQRAGIVAVAPDRIDFQVPFGLETDRTVVLRVSRGGVEAPPALVRLAVAAPGIFTYTYGETRSIDVLNEAAAVVTNADGTLNYPSQPAHPGDTITLRVTGLGDVDPRPELLQRGPRAPASVLRLPEVLIDGRPAAVESALLAPGEAGLYDVRATIPTETRTGVRVLVQLRAGGILSNRAVLAIE